MTHSRPVERVSDPLPHHPAVERVSDPLLHLRIQSSGSETRSTTAIAGPAA